jgi:hypothetical protein
MNEILGWAMTGRQRNYTPRVRTTRPLGAPRTPNAPPGSTLPEPVPMDGQWYLPPPLSQRLHEKSALGKRTKDGGILLTPEEVLFCHWYRHVPLTNPEVWLEHEMVQNPGLEAKVIAMDVLRNGGERVVPMIHLNDRFPTISANTWALRFERHESWRHHGGFSQIRVQRTHDEVNWEELNQWVQSVHEHNHVPELCVIDDELDATIYTLSHEKPNGDQILLDDLTPDLYDELASFISRSVPVENGVFISDVASWPLPAIGIEHFSGRFLRNEEHEYLQSLAANQPAGDLYAYLASQRLLLCPGFKFGCLWRVYETGISVEHAPWLIQPVEEAATNWEGICLAVRLAEGVNKRWLCGSEFEGEWTFLNIQRSG